MKKITEFGHDEWLTFFQNLIIKNQFDILKDYCHSKATITINGSNPCKITEFIKNFEGRVPITKKIIKTQVDDFFFSQDLRHGATQRISYRTNTKTRKIDKILSIDKFTFDEKGSILEWLENKYEFELEG